ncbi:MAG: hypothetical protein WC656_09070 [Sulfurimonas sp.]|jgi:TPR repeat protein
MIKILAVLIFISSGVFADTLETMNRYIKEAKTPLSKQMLICERDADVNLKNADAKECLKAADMLLALKGKKLDDYESSFPVSVERMASGYFKNAGGIYEAQGDYKNAIIMYEKAAEQNNSTALNNLGILYANGEGVPKNYTKAYQYWKEASALGNKNAEQALQALCSKNSSACK